MLGTLNEEKIEDMLYNQLLGRIGCTADDIPYIVPVHYVYKPPFIYAHSAPGMKLDIMRKNPAVCFEIDHIDNYFNWQSVICHGMFEEINEIEEREQAMQWLTGRIEPYLSTVEDSHPSHGITERAGDIRRLNEVVVYKIRIYKKTGRFENQKMFIDANQEI